MDDFSFVSPTRMILRRGAIALAGEEVKRYSDSVLLTHYGDRFIYDSGLRDRVMNALEGAGLRCFELPGVQPNPTLDLVYKGIEICRKEKVGFVLALGGGSVIDTAKAVAVGTAYDGDVWDLYLGKASVEQALPVGSIMTLPATGSEGSNGSVITNMATKQKRDIMSDVIRPAFTLMDPELTFTLPRKQTVYGVVDMISHVMERYFSSSVGNDLTDRMGEAIMVSAMHNARRVLKNPADYDARAELMVSSVVAHNGLVGIGRAQDWASHCMGAQLSGYYNIVHGATLSVLIPAWVEYVYRSNVPRFAQFAVRVMGAEPDWVHPEETAKEGIRRLRAFYRELGAPQTMQEIGVRSDADYAAMAKLACGGGKIGCIRPLGEEDVIRIFRAAETNSEE